MGLAGFGAIRAMQDSLKMNRQQLKRHRKSAGQLSEMYPARRGGRRKKEKQDPAKIAAFREHLVKQTMRDRRRNILLLTSLIALGIVMLWLMFV